MSWQFAKIDLHRTNYQCNLDWEILTQPPVDDLNRVYRDYCRHKHFMSVIPMIPGRYQESGTEIIGYRDQGRLVAWSMYRIWDEKNIMSDHFAWDYREPRLRLGAHSIKNECAIYRDRGYRWMYFESIEPHMLDMQGFELLGPMQ